MDSTEQKSRTSGYAGQFVAGQLAGKNVLCMQGRFHYYEGYTMQQVTFPVRVLKLLGIRYLFVSNASGGVNPSFRVGDLMVITDHINLMPNPLIGPIKAEFGPRFPDMLICYDQHLIIRATRIAEEKGIKLQYGVYVGGTGPTFETQAEYRYFKAIGGDAAGMSVCDAVDAALLLVCGGAGALRAKSVQTLEVIAWPDLGCEAVRRLTVKDMPLTVILDAHGGDLYQSGPAAYLEAK